MTEIVKIIDGFKIIEYCKSNILVIENLLDESFCNDTVNIIDNLHLIKNNYKEGNHVKCYSSALNDLIDINDTNYYLFSTEEKKYVQLMNKVNIKNSSISTNNLNCIKKEKITCINEYINDKMQLINNLLIQLNSLFSVEYNSGYTLRKICGKTRLHVDNIDKVYNSNISYINGDRIGDYKMIRNCSIIFALNDNYDGGTLRFPYHDISIKLKKGSVILFPPYWTHPHESDELENDTFRYTINTWSCVKI